MSDHMKYNKKYREARLADGLCAQCGRNPLEPGRKHCTECKQRNKLRRMKIAAKKQEGICTRCKKEKEVDGFAQCKECRVKAAEIYSMKKEREQEKENQHQERIRKPTKDSLCWHCENFFCSWRQSFQPVDGWRARKTKKAEVHLKNGGTREIQCYMVKECPEFKRTGHYANDEEWESGLVSE